jgi:hypothetical protein
MPGVADQHDVATGFAVSGHFHVHLGHQRAGGVEDRQATLRALAPHGLGHAVRGEHHGGVVGHLGQFVDEYGPGPGQAIDHEAVVHDFVAHVNRRAE